MKTYEVELERISYTTITVQAENEDAAEEAAWEELAKGDFKDDSASWRVESVEEVFS
jgi:aspartate/glutamate racemase